MKPQQLKARHRRLQQIEIRKLARAIKNEEHLRAFVGRMERPIRSSFLRDAIRYLRFKLSDPEEFKKWAIN